MRSSMPFSFENAYDEHAKTPGPGRAVTADQKLVVNFAASMLRHDVDPEQLAADLLTQPVEVQRALSKFVFAMLGHWAEFGELTGPSHPLADVFATARKMVNKLFD